MNSTIVRYLNVSSFCPQNKTQGVLPLLHVLSHTAPPSARPGNFLVFLIFILLSESHPLCH